MSKKTLFLLVILLVLLVGVWKFHSRPPTAPGSVDAQGGPHTLGGVVAVRPIGGQAEISAGVREFQTAAAAVTPFAPATAGAVGEILNGDVDEVRGDDTQEVGGHDGVGLVDYEPLAGVAVRAAVGAKGVGDGEVGVVRAQAVGVLG